MKQPKDYIVFPLDLPSYDQAMSYVDRLNNQVGLFKVGLELFISQGPRILKSIRDTAGAGIFLDLARPFVFSADDHRCAGCNSKRKDDCYTMCQHNQRVLCSSSSAQRATVSSSGA